jgi:hypothetical protein
LIPPIRRSSLLLFSIAVCLGVVSAARCLNAQSFDATNLRQPTDLTATWLVHDGDNPAYARADFDDSQWARFDPTTSLHKVIASTDPRVVWYRLHVKVLPSQLGLALEEWNISSAFEVYVNGQLMMKTGRVAPFTAYTFGARLLKQIPDREIATGSLVIAMRVHISRTEWDDQFAGFYATNMTLGQQQGLHDQIWLTVLGGNAIDWMITMAGLGLGIVALALYTAQREHREYLWIFLQFMAPVCVLPVRIIETFHNVPAYLDLFREPFGMAAFYFAVLMYLALLRVRLGWWTRALAIVSILGAILSDIGQTLGSISRLASILALFPLIVLIAGVVPVILIAHMRRGNREAGILLIPVVLQSLSIYIEVVLFFVTRVPAWAAEGNRVSAALFRYPAGPFQLGLGQLGSLLYVLSLAVIIVLRSTRISRQQALLEGEMAAAREVQELILPEAMETVPGFAVESVYEPAQQVGGDFFQILPAGEGGLLLVMGDVAGKGLPAAMLVSVLVGAIRGVAAFTREPAEMLANLNERLVGRAGAGFATALVAHIAADGRVTVANAGHLSPYLDGREVELAGALPLGVKSRTRYETKHFYLAEGSRLTFYSDGVVEAQNQRGELLGFDRGEELSVQPAVEIVEAAKSFGQRDDITVVAITRDSLIANAA